MEAVWNWLVRSQTAVWIVLGLIAAVAGGGLWMRNRLAPPTPTLEQHGKDEPESTSKAGPQIVDFPRDSWSAASIAIQPAARKTFALSLEFTGKVTLNEDRVAHVFPLVDGRVQDVKAQLGDQVKKGDVLVVVQSKEVGQAMLQLFQDRMSRNFAETKNRWTQEASANTEAMIQLIRDAATLEQIEKQLANRPMGEYRDKLMTAYVSHYKTRKTLDRLSSLSQDGVVPGKQLLEADADWNAARAGLQSMLEQLHQDAQQAATLSQQSLKELETRVAVDETNLKILGYQDQDLASIDPAKQGESLSHYPIRAPLDGTIISKDVVLMERVEPAHQILSVADLSTVWVSTDVYEEHLPLLKTLENQRVQLHNHSWPDRAFEAKVFYTGDVIDESTRTISLRAEADNAHRLLKPGMFVTVEFSGVTQPNVLQVPLAAILDHEGAMFVFVHTGGDRFERRDVKIGRRNAESAEILSGIKAGDPIATSGGFALKSRLLASLLSEE